MRNAVGLKQKPPQKQFLSSKDIIGVTIEESTDEQVPLERTVFLIESYLASRGGTDSQFLPDCLSTDRQPIIH